MKTIFLLRHAKSSWENYLQSDFERPLNERGRNAAAIMGKLIQRENIMPAVLIASPSVRTRETAAIVISNAKIELPPQFDERIYEASLSDLFAVVQSIGNEHRSVMLVGHNPGMESLLTNLTGEKREMPTAALTEIAVEIEDWNDLTIGCGKMLRYFTPKEITK